MSQHDAPTPVLPMELWTHHIIPHVERNRKIRCGLTKGTGSVIVRDNVYRVRTSTITLSVLSWTCKDFLRCIKDKKIVTDAVENMLINRPAEAFTSYDSPNKPLIA